MCLAEHKVPKEEIEAVQAKFSAMGHKSWWTQASRTERGISGGTSLHMKKCFKGHRVDWASLPKGQLLHADPKMWTGVVIQGLVNCVVVSAYFKDAIGMKDENLSMLTEILSWLAATGLPWLIVADWNTTPELLAQSDGLNGTDAVIIPPKDVAITCTAGQGRLLDFVVASPGMAPLVSVGVDMSLETKPHLALAVKIQLGLLNDKVLVLSAPSIPATLKVGKNVHRVDMELPEDPAHVARRRKLPRKREEDNQDEQHARVAPNFV